MERSLAALLNLMRSLKTQTGKFVSSRHTLDTAGTSRRFMQALLNRLVVAEIADATSLDVRH